MDNSRKGNLHKTVSPKWPTLLLLMKILLAAATEEEIAPSIHWLRAQPAVGAAYHQVAVCITGVGLVSATYELTKAIVENEPDYVLGVGVAGAFSRGLSLCDCVVVETEQIADFGAEDGETFWDAFSMGLLKANRSPYAHRLMRNSLQSPPFPIAHLPRVAGLTVTKVSGYEPTIAQREAHYGAAIETMEGAALHYVCIRMGKPFLQLRAISNYVTRRDRKAWRMADAIAALNVQLEAWLQPLG